MNIFSIYNDLLSYRNACYKSSIALDLLVSIIDLYEISQLVEHSDKLVKEEDLTLHLEDNLKLAWHRLIQISRLVDFSCLEVIEEYKNNTINTEGPTAHSALYELSVLYLRGTITTTEYGTRIKPILKRLINWLCYIHNNLSVDLNNTLAVVNEYLMRV